jgi:Transactive response DNA-binding protein N-terminal domain
MEDFQKYIKCSNSVGGKVVALCVSEDGTVLMSTLRSVFHKASGISYFNEVIQCDCVIDLENEKFRPPATGWDSKICYTVIEELTGNCEYIMLF